ncbi:MAG: TonB-dependent receptor [Sphingomonadaceae bacterium]
MRVAGLLKLGSSLAVIGIATAAVMPTAASAQTSQATLRGTAPAGATVTVTNVETGSVRTAQAGSNGTYELVGLQPGNYHVAASGGLEGDVTLSVASVSVLDLAPAAQAAAGGNQIVVTGVRQTVEVKSSQVNQIVSLHDIANLPQATRNFLEFASVVPGVAFTVDQSGNTSLRGGAQLDSAVNVYIDGVSQKDYVGSGGGTGGSGSGFTGSGGSNGQGDPGNPFPQLAIGEYKVVTSNYSAEYGDASSAIIIASTKSGTNQFHGEIFGDYTDSHLRASRPDEIAAGTGKAPVPTKEYGAAISGPIIKDVAHFFFTWEHKSLANFSTVFPDGSVPTSVIAQLPSNLTSQFGPVSNPFTENLYFGKIDIEPTSRDRLEFTGSLRLETNITGGDGQNALSTQSPYKNDVKRGDFHWQHNADHWTNEFRASYQYANSSAIPTTASPQFDYTYFPNDPNSPQSNQNGAGIINVGGPGSGVGVINKQRGWTFADNLTFTNFEFAGTHSLKLGVSYGAIKLTTQNASSDLNNATYYYAVTNDGTVQSQPWQVQFPNLTAGFNTPNVTTTDKQFGAYIQDTWDVNDKLEFNIGIRVDHEVVPAYLNYVTPANVVAALNGPFPGTNQTYASVLATDAPGAPGININDYVSTGSNRKAPWNFSPRLGFSYDFHGDGRIVVFGGYARAYNRNLFSTLALETTKIALNGNPQVYFPSAQTQDAFGPCRTAADINADNHCYAWDPSYLTPEGLAQLQTSPTSHEVDLMRNDIKTPYSDQFSLGIRNKIGHWNTQATLSYVASYDGIYGHWGARYADGSYYQNGSQWGAQGVPGVGSLILWDNGFKDTNWQVALAAQKPYTKASGWSATISYTYSAAKQNNSYAYGAGGNMYLFDYPTIASYPLLTSTAVPRHRLVISATKDLFWGISMGARLSLATQTPVSAIYGCGPNVTGCTAMVDGGGNTYYVNSIGGGTGGIAVLKPSGGLGYKDLDVQFTKDFNLFHSVSAYGRIDIFNVFNWHNYATTNINYTNNVPTSATPNTTGPIYGTPFEIKFTAGMRF